MGLNVLGCRVDILGTRITETWKHVRKHRARLPLVKQQQQKQKQQQKKPTSVSIRMILVLRFVLPKALRADIKESNIICFKCNVYSRKHYYQWVITQTFLERSFNVALRPQRP